MHLPGSGKLKKPVAIVAGWLGAAILIAAIAAGGVQPVDAGGAGLSYQQVTRVMFQQQTTPAPGTYPNGSFDADFQAASAGAKPRGQGLFNTIKWAMGAVQGLRTGQAVTIYEWNGMRREDKADQTSEIDIPAKNERILLNLATKTYEIIDESQQQAEPEESMGPMPTMPPMNSPPPMKPGTAVVFITTTTTDLGPKILDNMPTEGYRVTSNIKWTQATGSCKGEDFQAGGEWVQFFSTYSEPTLAPRPMPKVTMPAALPSMPALPSLQSLKNAMATGCKPIVKASIQRGVHIPYNRMVVWQFFGASAQMPNQDQQQEGQESMQTLGALSGNPNGPPGFGFLIERGSVKVLGPSAASLFKVPAGFTQGKVMQ